MSLEDLMQSLKSEYLADLPAKIELIESHCQEDSLSQLREDFHKLKGTGKTYGIPEISLLAEVIETMVLKNPKKALMSKSHFLALLTEIHGARMKDQEFPIESDPRYLELVKN